MARATLDQVGGHGVKVLPSTQEMLHEPIDVVIHMPEVDWTQPRPEDWVQGGAWGSQRAVLFSGLR